MLPIGQGLDDIKQLLTDAGVPAVVDARNLALPGAWVTPGVISFDTMDADAAFMRFDVYLIAPDHGAVHSLNELGGMLAKLRAAVPIGEAQPVMVNLPNHGADPMPALLISIDAQLTED